MEKEKPYIPSKPEMEKAEEIAVEGQMTDGERENSHKRHWRIMERQQEAAKKEESIIKKIIDAKLAQNENEAIEKIDNWDNFCRKYVEIIGGNCWSTEKDAAEKLAKVAEQNGSLKSVKINDQFLFTAEIEVIPGWKVACAFTSEENKFPNAQSLNIEDSGEFYKLDNYGAYHLREDVGEYKKGEEAPKDAFIFDDFVNSNNYGYKWITPNPFTGEAKNMSSSWAKQNVYAIIPEGEYLGDFLDVKRKVWDETDSFHPVFTRLSKIEK